MWISDYILWSCDSFFNIEDYLVDELCIGNAQGARREHPCTSDTFLVKTSIFELSIFVHKITIKPHDLDHLIDTRTNCVNNGIFEPRH